MNTDFSKVEVNSKSRAPRKIKLLRILSIGLLIIIAYTTYDYIGPKEIPIKEDHVFGFEVLRARDLLVQEYDKNGNLWATRGMIVYVLRPESTEFIRVDHVPTGLNIYWLRNFSLLRKITIRPECVELTVTERGDLCAISAGKMWVKKQEDKKFKKSLVLRKYGFGDQGVRNAGLLSLGDSTVYYGEYFQNKAKGNVFIYQSMNNLNDFKPAYEFKTGEIEHIHAVQHDQFSNLIWICTGDGNEESIIARSDYNLNDLDIIGTGNQQWRVCQLVFTKQSVYWGTDNGTEDMSGIFKYDREDKSVAKISKVDGAVLYATQLANELIVMSTDREGMNNEKDDKTKLFIIDHEKVSIIKCGTWKHNNPGFWFKYAKLRLQRNQGGEYLAISVLNQKELPDSDLILIHQDTLLNSID